VIDMNEILPADQRYFQFFGSLTTPPCTEGVLWMVMKQPLRISPEQFRLFSQQYPFNARPVQAVNGRPVREAK
jgi:carbonic anhydrase